MAVKDYSTNPDENTTISGINIAEGCLPSGINNAIRQLMADVKQESEDQSKVMTGATASAAGTAGNVPAPAKGSQGRPLRGDGTWASSLSCNITGLAAKATADASGNIITETYATKSEIPSLGMPVGSIYVQFSGQSAPADLFGGTWSNVSSTYAGLFFRAEGGDAAAFGSIQTGGLPNITGTFDRPERNGVAPTSGVFYNPNQGGSGYARDEPISSANVGFNASRSSGLYGASEEVRPVNSAIRIWKRTA